MFDDLAIMRHKCSPHLKRRGHNDSVRRVSVHVFSKEAAADGDLYAQRISPALTIHKRSTYPALTIALDFEAPLCNEDSNLPAGDDADVQVVTGSCGVYRVDYSVVQCPLPQNQPEPGMSIQKTRGDFCVTVQRSTPPTGG